MSMRIGTGFLRLRISLQTAKPSSLGNMRSRRMRSGDSVRARVSPCSPSSAGITRCPSASRASVRPMRSEASSSMSRMRAEWEFMQVFEFFGLKSEFQ